MSEVLLEVKGLKTYFRKGKSIIRAVDGVDFNVNKQEILGIVGESGCGKSITCMSIMRLLPEYNGKIVGGEILFNGEDLVSLDEKTMCKIRGKGISMIFQEPMTSLNPVYKCGDQIAEAIVSHLKISKTAAYKKAVEMLRIVGIPDPDRRAGEYPHQLSGGMRQRVMIAMALSCNPQLLIADEPTTALDVTIQAQVIELLKKLQKDIGMSIIMITHDLGVISKMADRVMVMYAGKVVEESEVFKLFSKPLHPYTKGLLKSIPNIEQETDRLNVIEGTVPSPEDMPKGCRFSPRCDFAQTHCFEEEPPLTSVSEGRKVACFMYGQFDRRIVSENRNRNTETYTIKRSSISKKDRENLLKIKNVKKYFPVNKGLLQIKKGYVKAVDDVSFTIKEGETFGLVGESGCGKTTLGNTIIRLFKPDEGEIIFNSNDIGKINGKQLKSAKKDIQMIFQDSYASLNPRMTVEQIITEPLIIHGLVKRNELHKKAVELIEDVGLSSYNLKRYPHEFSGGQRQRIGIARALALSPKLIVCDEPVSALDESIQSQILNLLKDLQRERGISYLFISHDLAAVKHISDRIGVMYLGKLVEIIDSKELLYDALHPYTQALISAIPVPNPELRDAQRIILEGDVPSPMNPPNGCGFHTRCRYAMEKCSAVEPLLRVVQPSHEVACHLCVEEMRNNSFIK